MNTIPIVEIFGPTIQGEGPEVGARCIFVRVKRCSYRCSWCDSKYTWYDHMSEVIEYSPEDLAEHLYTMCKNTNCYHIILTGGNPCIYNEFETVIATIYDKIVDYNQSSKIISIDVETQGDLLPSWLGYCDTIVFSPKAPSSGMPDTFDNITKFIIAARNCDRTIAIKIPVFTDADIEFARKYAKFVSEFHEQYFSNLRLKMYVDVGNSDVDTTDAIRDRVLSDYEKLLNKINENPEDFQHVYILPQIHTLVWGNKTGV